MSMVPLATPADDPYEPYLYRHLLAAGQGLVATPLADPPDAASLSLAQQLFDVHLTTSVPALVQASGTILQALLATPFRSALLAWALAAAQDPWGLGRLGLFAADAAVRSALLAWLPQDPAATPTLHDA